MLNSFIKKEKFPTKWKKARISSRSKVPTPIELSDYRPMLVLPVLFKIYEKLVMKQIIEFIENHELCQSTQSGFTLPKK